MIWANNSASPDSGVITDWPGGTSAALTDNIAALFLGGFLLQAGHLSLQTLQR
jgi:hypothetical protein